MNNMKRTVLTVIVATAICLASCVKEPTERRRNNKTDKVTFVINIPVHTGGAADGVTRAGGVGGSSSFAPVGFNAHGRGLPDGLPAGYENYFADSDSEKYGEQHGGYDSY